MNSVNLTCAACHQSYTRKDALTHSTHSIHAQCLSILAMKKLNECCETQGPIPDKISCFECQVAIPLKEIAEKLTNVNDFVLEELRIRSLEDCGLVGKGPGCTVL